MVMIEVQVGGGGLQNHGGFGLSGGGGLGGKG